MACEDELAHPTKVAARPATHAVIKIGRRVNSPTVRLFLIESIVLILDS